MWHFAPHLPVRLPWAALPCQRTSLLFAACEISELAVSASFNHLAYPVLSPACLLLLSLSLPATSSHLSLTVVVDHSVPGNPTISQSSPACSSNRTAPHLQASTSPPRTSQPTLSVSTGVRNCKAHSSSDWVDRFPQIISPRRQTQPFPPRPFLRRVSFCCPPPLLPDLCFPVSFLRSYSQRSRQPDFATRLTSSPLLLSRGLSVAARSTRKRKTKREPPAQRLQL